MNKGKVIGGAIAVGIALFLVVGIAYGIANGNLSDGEFAIAITILRSLLIIFFAIGLAFIPSTIAKKKGYSFAGFYLFGFFFFLPALIVALCIKDKNQEQGPNLFTANTTNVSMADELRKYKQLYDDGVISEQEFADVKRKILSEAAPNGRIRTSGNYSTADEWLNKNKH